MEQPGVVSTPQETGRKMPDIKDVLSQLKEACDNDNYEQLVKVYILLGNHYSSQKYDYINAIAIYNFALALCQDDKKNQAFKQEAPQLFEDIIRLIKSAEQLFLLKATGKSLPATSCALDKAHKEFLKGIRNEARAKLAKYKAITKLIELQLPENAERLKKEQAILQALEEENLSIQQTYQHISQQMREFVNLLINECKKELSIWRHSPNENDYAVICFGSLARDEATPYSDLEFGILLREETDAEENKEYFRNLTKLLNIKVINLGETTPRMQYIKDLEEVGLLGRYSKSPIKHGFCFDGNNKDGRKTPLGNMHFDDVPDDQKYELIQTPKGMAELHNEKWFEKDKHLSTVLLTASVIEGSEELCKIYEQEIFESTKLVIQKRSLDLLRESVESYQFRGGRFEKEGHFFDAKYHLYRQPNMILDHLATYFSIKEKSLWNKIVTLFGESGVIKNKSIYLNLRDVVSMVLKLRLELYLKADYYDNHVIPLDPGHFEQSQVLLKYHLGIDLEKLFQMYVVLIPFRKIIEIFVEKNGSKQVLSRYIFCDNDLFVRGYIYNLLLDYERAASVYEESEVIYEEKYGADNPLMSSILVNLGNVYTEQAKYKEGIEKYKKAIIITKKNYGEMSVGVGIAQNNLGIIYAKQGCYTDAIQLFHMAKEIGQAQQKNHYLIADAMFHLGNVYTDLALNNEAIDAYNKSQEIYDLNFDQDSVALVLHSLGNVYQSQAKYEAASTAYNNSKSIFVKIFGAQHILIADSICGLGNVFLAQSKYKEAKDAYERAREIKMMFLDGQHPTIAKLQICLGRVYRAEGDIVNALELFQKSFETLCHAKEDKMIAENMADLGNIFLNRGDFQKALEIYNKAVMIMNKINQSNHPIVARILINVGNIYRYQLRYTESREEFKKVERIFNFGYDKKHPHIAEYLANIANLHVEEKDFINARNCYLKAIEILEEYNHISRNIVERNLQCSYIREGNQFRLNGDTLNAHRCYHKSNLSLNQKSNLFLKGKIDKYEIDMHNELASMYHYYNQVNAAIEHYKIIIIINQRDAIAHNNIACLIHVLAQIEKDKCNKQNYLSNLKEAAQYFLQSMKLNMNVGVCTEYAQFKFKNNDYFLLSDIIIELGEVIKMNQLSVKLNYKAIERSIVDDNLQKLIDSYEGIVIRAHFLAYYLLIQAYLLNNQVDQAKQIYNSIREEIIKLKPVHEEDRIKLVSQIGKIGKNNIKKAEIFQQIEQEKEKQLIDELLIISQNDINNFKSSITPKKNTKVDSGLQIAIEVSLENSTGKSQIVNFTAARDKARQRESIAIHIFSGLSAAIVRDAHNTLLNRINTFVADKRVKWQSFLAAIKGKDYAKALRRACANNEDETLFLVKILLEYKEILSININQQTEDKLYSAIHYAAINGNQALYDLLIEHGADATLKDRCYIAAAEYMVNWKKRQFNGFHLK